MTSARKKVNILKLQVESFKNSDENQSIQKFIKILINLINN